MKNVSSLFEPAGSDHPYLFQGSRPWDPIKRLPAYLEENAQREIRANVHPLSVIDGRVSIGSNTRVDAFAIVRGSVLIEGDCFIGRALVRDCIIEAGAIIGNGCEIARSIIRKGANVYHNSVVLDSVVGAGVGVGGGTLLANTNLNDSTIRVTWAGERVDTGLLKLGPLVGDGCKFGMGCLVYPGAVLGKNSIVGAGVHLEGSHEPRTYVKAIQTIRAVTRRDRRVRLAS